MKIVLVPVDFSTATEPLVEFVADFAMKLGAYVVLVHVVRGDGAGVVGIGDLADVALQRVKGALRDRGINTQALLLVGEAATQILEQARKLRAHYIVLGSNGHGSWHRLVLGTTSSTVLRSASCPVVIVPPDYRLRRTPDVRALEPQPEAVEI